MSSTPKIPDEVILAAPYLVVEYGNLFKHAGKIKSVDYYSFIFPDDINVGFPVIVSYEQGTAKRLEGQELRDVMILLGE